MFLTNPFRPLLLALPLAALFFVSALTNVAFALPPAGTDTVTVVGQVSITSRTGQETIDLVGTATIQRAAPHSKGSVDAIDAEITAMSLSGSSVTGPVTVTESPTQTSSGEIRAMSGSSFPATSYFDVYAIVTVPASPNPSITLHNETVLHFDDPSLFTWPPYNAEYDANPVPPILLQPSISNPAQIRLSSATMTISTPGVGGITELASVRSEEGADARDRTPNDHVVGIAVALALLATAGVVANFARARLRSGS